MGACLVGHPEGMGLVLPSIELKQGTRGCSDYHRTPYTSGWEGPGSRGCLGMPSGHRLSHIEVASYGSLPKQDDVRGGAMSLWRVGGVLIIP